MINDQQEDMRVAYVRLIYEEFVSTLVLHANENLLLDGELLAERCRTDDLMPSIYLLCLPPCRVNPEIL